ncbi:MAG: Asp-tRNA(Asn)/Glu-tRNA(Gln) amidotransferase subunit GatB [Anaerolineae bacterium]|uniref:Asp-tRNA(Asn)/Glu-tRNA(Gln) amidotransferase subunit GatB n=1 Tax=Promineifilum sp. TaxID=2664178 RepID=UPI001D2A4050|nr:Asp-tRNA(Asn)/Glu-tRNA(Gln) amidotransferase subunit GatB [Anaerolineales bacterium]MCB8936623.1 Asp-tRNA(Asn)/Glu-tRNA(Gln) amidotransferase subunit GatB [Promineifilum sp.]MCO5178794.1 Asp-tRNA(Asn)/Glu-tRNA(Gln) amidotransferase subunit GatB [Promineifilum sp.]MCW5846860.1 Asp-tRNA(Asn)/Glu-tRNA(Gln) amidotransferase subunit GatB [Anaerolineae bacterium]
MLERYEPVIGLEIHAELLTRSKMFCGCRVVDSVEAAPNTAVCPVCLGMPGMLPVINRRAVEFALRVALALGCEIQPYNIFARKNYFYPDLPKGYQISQYELPIGRNGALNITLSDGATKRIGIRRVHMEEDTGKLTHLDGGSLVDYNRSGVPLLEIVTEPDIRSGEEARAYATRIRQILRYLGVNTGDMEKGVLRIEPNISIRPRGSNEFGTRIELKNLNSFRVLADGTDYELRRQADLLDAGGHVVQETRGWHETRRETFSQRAKEEAEDYRYFAEPDLPPLLIDEAWIESARATLPELPQAKEARYRDEFGLTPYEATALADDHVVAEWFDAAVVTADAAEAGGNPKVIANWILNDLFRLLNERERAINQIDLSPSSLVDLLSLVARGVINQNTAREVLAEMIDSGRAPAAIIEERGLGQISDEPALVALIDDLIAANPEPVAAYLGGKENLLGWFVGQIMRATRGQGNPAMINKLLRQRLEHRRSM